MTKKTMEEAKALAAIAADEDRGGRERLAAFEEADAARKELKAGWSKLGLTVEQVTALKDDLPALAALDEADEADETAMAAGLETEALQALGEAEPDDASSEASEEPGESIPADGEAFEATPEELAAQVGRPKTQEQLDAEDAEALERAAKKVRRAKESGSGEERGGLTRLVESLLMDPALSYLDIINAVLKDFPKANTSARSIASVAAGMRRAGKNVPMRRPVAKPKIVAVPPTAEQVEAAKA